MPKMIDMKEMDKNQVRTKNIIHTKPTVNRGPKSPEKSENDDQEDPAFSAKNQKMMQAN